MKIVLAVAIALAVCASAVPAPKKALRSRLPKVPAAPEHSRAEWRKIADGQALGREVRGTQPQDPLAGRVAVAKKPRAVEGRGLRIINGGDANLGQFPWMAFIKMDDTYTCGGSLISEKFILTSAMCSSGYSQFSITLGDTNSFGQEADSWTHFFTYKSIWHEDYNEESNQNDIGLLTLLYPVSFNDYIRPVKLPSTADVDEKYEGVMATVSGWGLTIYGRESEYLQYIKSPIMTNVECARYLGSEINATKICSDGEGRIGTCGDTDSGDPLVISVPSADNAEVEVWTQVGIASFQSELGCDLSYPSAYTRVTEYLSWIQTNTGLTL